MTTDEYLKQARWLEEDINADLEDLLQEKKQALALPSTRWGEEKVQNRKARKEAEFEEHVDMVTLLENRIREKQKLLQRVRGQIRGVLQGLENPRERRVLTAVYLGYRTRKEIAESLHRTYRYVRGVTSSGMKNIVLPEEPIDVRKEAEQVGRADGLSV